MPVDTPKETVKRLSQAGGRLLVGGVPEGFDALLLAALATEGGDVLMVSRDDVSMARKAEALSFFAPGLEKLEFPAWDCLPYDRVSPRPELVSRRIDTLTRILRPPEKGKGRVILTTVSALLQRVPPKDAFADVVMTLKAGQRLDPAALSGFLSTHGYVRADTVMEPGEYARRGGIVDVFPAGAAEPLRLDFFGDELEALRAFDAATQRTTVKLKTAELKPVSEVMLDDGAISRFRSGYRVLFAKAGDDDPLYGAVSAGHRHIGMEHWLPLFHEKLETLLDYAPEARIVLDHQAEEARDARLDLITEYYTARRGFMDAKPKTGLGPAGTPYHPVPPEALFLDAKDWDCLLAGRAVAGLSPFAVADDGPGSPVSLGAIDAGARAGHDFADVRVQPGANVFDALRDHVREQQAEGRRVVITAFTQGSMDRLASLLDEHGLSDLKPVEKWEDAAALDTKQAGLAVVGLERGFVATIESGGLAVITEPDILGDRMSRPSRPRVRPENFIAEASVLGSGDLVVHMDHGIGRFDGLDTIKVGGAPHDCLRLLYDGGDKLFLPVENIEVISRYGSEEAGAQLDRLGGAAWQARKARLKERIRDMADELIRVAAARELKTGVRIAAEEGIYGEFSARFPFTETEDQAKAIDDTMADLGGARPMDRLICGDVGFGKTEVALRAAFATALDGLQVAVVVPTTLLCRQHFQTFGDRFRGLPMRIEQISRLVTAKRVREVKAGLADGTVDIVIGTHALLAKDVEFRDLGLLVIDEEQHFGVSHKEKLKKLKADVHVLTLTATPIPRTLQLALTGLREMSLIATPPVDRLAVRTFILPYDPVIVREAILREKYRGGQTFYVGPRISDLDRVVAALGDLVPEVTVAAAHGRLGARDLESTMTGFYDGAFDVLVSTNIIESGLDLPAVNTIVIHRADMFGLAQLYQLRGRVGRSKVRAYAYLTLPPGRMLSPAAKKRLEVMQTLDTLGAGFSLASHDLDIRGAGNLLGAEQSGHIREVGIELYQQMLEEAVAEARGLAQGQNGGRKADDDWSPAIAVGMPVMIPDSYVGDLTVRMGLYRRLAWLSERDEIDAFAAELIDRFGPLPDEVENLLQVVALKKQCREAGVEKVDAGVRGAVVSFRKDHFANPAGLVAWITGHGETVKLRPDHTLVLMRGWEAPAERMEGVRYLVGELARIAGEGEGQGEGDP
ncbi:MAG: transcription-repair coupling factor [Rhodospirillaceae bacterium]|jgi:transcription-repair coupling factor (superfamily II helicase)|nr:transcription-repair coupling factor [Rhodospirillaceae bacterium]